MDGTLVLIHGKEEKRGSQRLDTLSTATELRDMAPKACSKGVLKRSALVMTLVPVNAVVLF
jgi:hypothetical protein